MEELKHGDYVRVARSQSDTPRWRGRVGIIRHVSEKEGFALVELPELDGFDVRCRLGDLTQITAAEYNAVPVPIEGLTPAGRIRRTRGQRRSAAKAQG